jgi:hypothetical protein
MPIKNLNYFKVIKEPSFFVLILIVLGIITIFFVSICDAKVNEGTKPYTKIRNNTVSSENAY